ncbi:hypothetical protein JOC33_000170 [Thalassobacillus pellis]|nr:hypothetical protein [Thalassobacillus pellis]
MKITDEAKADVLDILEQYNSDGIRLFLAGIG